MGAIFLTFMQKIDFKKYSKMLLPLVALGILGISFFAGMVYGYDNRPGAQKIMGITQKEPPAQFSNVDFNLFWDVWSKLEDKFVDKSKLDREKLLYGAISGLVSAAKDPYTEFMPPVENQQFQQDIKGEFGGIGAEIGVRKGILTIISPLKGNPAEKAGLKAGDKVLKIDDTITTDVALEEAVRMIRGPKGSEVRLTILREGTDKAQEFKVMRDDIQVPIVETEKKPDGVFVIRLNHFTENAGTEFKNAVKKFFDSHSKKIVFDLRNNPGGFLSVSVDIASWFLQPGDIVARERFGDGTEESYRSSGYRLLENTPTVVLINEGSASASEIVAGALRDLKNTPLIGTKSYGKGSVQEVEQLEKGSSLKITIAKWLTPKGIEINGKGLEPDFKVDVTQAQHDKEPDRDFVMEKALEVLKSK